LHPAKYVPEHGRFDALAGPPSAKEIEGAFGRSG
jgi:hypothetical protein